MGNQENNIEFQFNEYGWCHNPIIVFQLFEGCIITRCTIKICQRYGKWFLGIENFQFTGSVFANERLVKLGECFDTKSQAILAGIKEFKSYIKENKVTPFAATDKQWSTLKNEINKFEQSILQPTLF